MKKILFLCAFLPLAVLAQTVQVVNFNQLEEIMAKEKEKTLVVNFWATWCVPCVKELGHFEKLSRDYAGKNVRVLLVSLDYPEKLETALKPFLKRKNITAETVLLDESNANQWIDRVSTAWEGSIPATLVINPAANTRNFYEREFTYEELENIIKTPITR